MNIEWKHPREILAHFMARVYRYGMTTTSGGNLSIKDEEGNLWITPAAIDKGDLTPEDIMCITPEGEIIGRHRPSSEYPFHQAIYGQRPDLKAVLHAHPTALVAFSIVRKVPDTRVIPQASAICGEVGYAPYALPGGKLLGEHIAQVFAEGFQCVLLENHGVVCGGSSMLETYHRFETLDFCARLLIQASSLGRTRVLNEEQLQIARTQKTDLPTFQVKKRSNREKELRTELSEMVRRAYDQQLMNSTEGTASVRVEGETFLITPTAKDRRYLNPEDIVRIEKGRREESPLLPSRATLLHQTLYQQHPHIQAIMSAQAPYSTAFAISETEFDTRTIPESYLVLRDIPVLPYGSQYQDPERIAQTISKDCPVILLQNDALLTTGTSLLEAYDRVEVADFTARSLIQALPLGELVAMEEDRLEELRHAFLK
ncbi:L-fuculose phosphate aldolase FucA [Planctomycetales bacterium 10988]|nr:L-fuculose phosphate aldolase FucA [Planctomycetales bacterium 10988]